jgi:hypothetical protein
MAIPSIGAHAGKAPTDASTPSKHPKTPGDAADFAKQAGMDRLQNRGGWGTSASPGTLGNKPADAPSGTQNQLSGADAKLGRFEDAGSSQSLNKPSPERARSAWDAKAKDSASSTPPAKHEKLSKG